MKQKKTLTSIILTILFLFSPIVLLKIGPGGYEFYGNDVPDIYIWGFTIFGKDKTVDIINYSYKFQLFGILTYFLLMIASYLLKTKAKIFRILTSIGFALLALFPIWFFIYHSWVVGNSDNSDLTTIPHIGTVIYIAILVNNYSLLKLNKEENRIKTSQ